MARVLIAGCGYVGCALGSLLIADGHEVWGLSRKPVELPVGVQPVEADVTRPESLGLLPEDIHYIVYSVGAQSPEESAYRAAYLDGLGNLLQALRDLAERPKRILFTSSTAVYGQRRGEWVDEESPTVPVSYRGEILLLAERLLLSGPFPAAVLRLGGIYGPGRSRLIEDVRARRAVSQSGPPHYTNRIHRDDAAGALRHLLALPEVESVYLGVDDQPSALGEVLRFIAGELGIELAKPDGEPGPAGRRRAGSKRCSNARLRASGYAFRFPSFREGYRELL